MSGRALDQPVTAGQQRGARIRAGTPASGTVPDSLNCTCRTSANTTSRSRRAWSEAMAAQSRLDRASEPPRRLATGGNPACRTCPSSPAPQA